MARILTPRFPDKRPAAPSAPEFVRTGRAAKRRKQLQRQRERESRTRLFLDRVPRAFVEFEPDGVVVDWNVRAAALFSWPVDSRSRLTLQQVLTPASWKALAGMLAAWPGATDGHKLELEAWRRSGTTVPIELAICRVSASPPVFAALVDDLSARRRGELAADLLAASASALATARDPVAGAGEVLRLLVDGLQADFAALWWLDPVALRLRFAMARVAEESGAATFERHCRRLTPMPGVGLPGRVVKSGEPVWIEDILNEDNFPRIGAALRSGLRSGFAVPVRRGGAICGALEVLRRTAGPGDPATLSRLAGIGDQLGLALESVAVRAQLNDA